MTPLEDESARSAIAAPPGAPTLAQIGLVFLTLGATAFGGPAAHIALMETELIQRRQWLSRDRFLDLIGLTSLIPGPNSTELAIHIGYAQAGWRGLGVAGLSFIAPAFGLVWLLAIAYVQFQSLPLTDALLYGVKPAVLAILVKALFKLSKTALKDYWLWGIGGGVVALNLLGVSELVLLVLAGCFNLLLRSQQRSSTTVKSVAPWLLGLLPIPPLMAVPGVWSAGQVFLYFLKIGSVLYGSGYVLFAFLQQDLVEKLGLLSSQQLLDAIAIGQLTPGPVFTTATFIGYLLAGHTGAIVGTLGIFLPAFLLVGLTAMGLERLRHAAWFRAFLNGVNVAALGLMAVVTVKLGLAAVVTPLTATIACLSLAIAFRWPRLNTAYFIGGGALLGLLKLL